MGVIPGKQLMISGGKKIKGALSKAEKSINSTIARRAALSPEELKAIESSRDKYLQGKPDPNDPAEVALTMRLMAANSIEIYNAYLPLISSLYYPIQPEAEYGGVKFDSAHNIRYFNITKWVIDKDEKNLEKLVNVYESLSSENCNIALVFHREIEKTTVYFAVTNNKNDDDNSEVENYIERLKGAIRGNFPGSRIGEVNAGALPCMGNNRNYSVASVTNVPTEKSEKFISQTIEKLIDGIVPERVADEYVLILLANPIDDVEERKLRLGEIYSGLKPYESWQTSYTVTEQDTRSSMATAGVNIGASAGVQNGSTSSATTSNSTADSSQEARGTNESRGTQTSDQTTAGTQTSNTNTTSQSSTLSSSKGGSSGTSTATTSGQSSSTNSSQTLGTNESYSSGENASGSVVVASVGTNYSTTIGNASSATEGVAESVSSSTAETISSGSTWSRGLSSTSGTSQAITTGESIARSLGRSTISNIGSSLTQSVGKTITSGIALAEGVFKSTSLGINFGANFARSSTVTVSVGKNDGITQTHTNYNIKHALELLEKQMKRYDKSTALGMWDFAAYVISENQNVASNVAHSYLGLTQGDDSFMSSDAVNLWRGDVADNEPSEFLYEYLRQLRHPVFGLNPDFLNLAEFDSEVDSLEKDDFYNGDLQSLYCYPPVVTATTPLSGKELAYSLNFPQKSLAGLPVIQCSRFGRSVNYSGGEFTPSDGITIGKIFHMDNVENVNVDLSLNSLASHTFITGSTGAGKSNTVYQILDKASNAGVKFLVVEPTKGEYKNIFGNSDGVTVYGTNPAISKLLRLNPFKFPSDIHVLEHIDRLTEIFNVCWPMYAAMPAVLKRAIEKSYEDSGWDLCQSINEYGDGLYPCFADVTKNVRVIIDSSDYDAENKGAYKGSLVTRLSSLATGLNGMIFTNNEIPDEELFDTNVIVDLSRVGSSETKSLLMGMLVLKLQEYRLSQRRMNAELTHITVLEEAHNLLKRTSTDQPVEGGNLIGKSVEMISNAIAEMRTYGEGFIIADQAPGLLDMAAIRNTNTKIILRLPDLGDRKLVGKAANLNDDQISELARLPKGIAAIYQNEWIEAVLCKVSKHPFNGVFYAYNPETTTERVMDGSIRLKVAELLSNGTKLSKEDILRDVKPQLYKLAIDASSIVTIMKLLESPPKEPRMSKLGAVMSVLYPEIVKEVAIAYSDATDLTEWTDAAKNALNKSLADAAEGSRLSEQARRDIIQSIITYYVWIVQKDQSSVERWYVEGGL